MKVRVKFTKTGSLRFTGHLDLMRFFQKALRISGIKMAYTKGYSPHMILSFAAPLGVGMESLGEYFDAELAYRDPVLHTADDDERLKDIGLINEELPLCPPASALIEMLNAVMPSGIRIAGITRIEEGKSGKAMSLVKEASYITVLSGIGADVSEASEKFGAFLTEEKIIVHKITKKAEADVDIRPMIHKAKTLLIKNETETSKGTETSEAAEFLKEIKADFDWTRIPEFYRKAAEGERFAFYAECATGSAAHLRPDMLAEAFCRYAGYEFNEYDVRVLRLDTFTDGGLSLSALGEDF